MNSLFENYSSFVTLYNKYYDPATKKEVYQKKEIPNAIWEDRKASTVLATGGEQFANQAWVYVPYDYYRAGYRTPLDWNSLSEKTGLWTLQVGDLIVKGIGPDLGDSYTPSDLRSEYDSVFIIRSIDARIMGSENTQHWKLGVQ